MTNKELAEKLINNFGGIPRPAREITLEAARRLLQMCLDDKTQVGEIQEAKSLRWLANMWPLVENPKDEADRMSTCIHLYCTAAADRMDQMAEAIDYARTINAENVRLTAENERLTAENERLKAELKKVKEYPTCLKTLSPVEREIHLLGKWNLPKEGENHGKADT